ncbi:universal stress protein [Natrononativus amylolyticus]|uniref:universal stress protein n=1 Tax=Natrononativus amylolyticus TaxID=2963434 RepID=UPI0020CBC689|nr:universal stress protein [Natrononativus amylolyticus]
MYRSLLVGTDGSATAAEATAHAIELASHLEIPLHVVAVVETRTAYDTDIVEPAEATRRLHERADTALTAAAGTASDAGVSTETAVRTGVPHEELLAYADQRGVSMLVVGARGRSSFRRALLGSTADALVRLSSIPVLVVGGSGENGESEG